MQENLTRFTRVALLAALGAWASTPARAVTLGEVEVRSKIGQPLDARVPLSGEGGEALESNCFTLSRESGSAVALLTDGSISVERAGARSWLRIRSNAPVREPAITVLIHVQCPSQVSGDSVRMYSVLVDPPTGYDAALPHAAVAATINTRPGDSLKSIARTVVPGNAAAQGRYLAALRALNPSLAASGEREALPDHTAVALPDLRDAASTHPAPAAATPRRPVVTAENEPSPRVSLPVDVERKAAEPLPQRAATAPAAPAKRSPPVAPTERPPPVAAPPRSAAPRAQSRAGARPSDFVLKLSGSEVDLSRSRQIDERARAKLRERLMVLDADDQVAAVLQLRDSLKGLEARVAELQLKLSALPPSLAARPGTPPPATDPARDEIARADARKADAAKAEEARAAAARAAAAKAEADKAEAEAAKTAAAKAETAKADAAKAEAAKAEASKAEAAKAEIARADDAMSAALAAQAAKADAARAPVTDGSGTKDTPSTAPPPRAEGASAPAAVNATAPAPSRAGARPAVPAESGLPTWLWGLVAILVGLALLLAIRMMRRQREHAAASSNDEWIDLAGEPPAETVLAEMPGIEDEPHATEVQARRSIASDADLATRLPENSSELRRRYLEERFPEIASRAVVLGDADSVVKGARLFYEDGALPRAVELLQFAIEDRPGEMKTWLALFEIFRLERLAGEYAQLAARFKALHGESDNWRKVRYFGREIDPGNALYKEDSFNTLETIGPRESRRLAATTATVDPIAENWLNAPMDFQNEVLANEMRQALMVEASVAEQDLIPNPMPALRNIEMFTVA